ncbi:sulfurtransferase TusA family protein [Ketobacter alkanivorans]|uniref:SirA family protein n=1 Tax=Ketobacter alkanivorans TaxID=1917421 RepID=A0A2K9LJL0_9GAMM|nr:sulfurtransferase TusA family protein [Ketobacter alkanivorans]AUM12417.1 SirA family protein [Ketobacter alkanivorans]
MTQHELDARGLLCPMPVIKTQNVIQQLAQGDRLRVLATDPGVLHDIPAWCRVNGHKLISSKEQEQEIEVIIEVCDI